MVFEKHTGDRGFVHNNSWNTHLAFHQKQSSDHKEFCRQFNKKVFALFLINDLCLFQFTIWF